MVNLQRYLLPSRGESRGNDGEVLERDNKRQTDVPLLNDSDFEHDTNIAEYIQDLLCGQQELVAAAQLHQQQVIDKYLSRSPLTVPTLKRGDLVLVSYPERPTDKLTAAWMGPFTVIEARGNNITCQHLASMRISTFYIDRLKLFDTSLVETTDQQRAIAATDNDMWLVERILSHRGKGKKKSNYSFRVRWTGFGEEGDTWEPYHNLKDTEALRDYSRLHPKLPL